MEKKVDLNRATNGADPDVVAQVHDLFEYHGWDSEKIAQGQAVRNVLASAFTTIISSVPPCPTRTRALNMLTDARMLANAAITHEGKY